jgi:hypothetical protein
MMMKSFIVEKRNKHTPLFRIWHSQHLEDKQIFWKCAPLINGARGVGSSTLIFTLGFVFCYLQISHPLKGFFNASRHHRCCTIILHLPC